MKILIRNISIILCLSALPACYSSEKHSSKVTTVSDSGASDINRTEERVVRTEEQTETKGSHEEHRGGLFSIIGDIIAWPFRVVGATLSEIF